MPKSACNTLMHRISASIDCDVLSAKSGGGIGHIIIDDRILLKSNRTIFTRKTPVVFQHFLPTEKNRRNLLAHLNAGRKPKVIVSVRNIYDVAVSCADHQRAARGPWTVIDHEKRFFDDSRMDEHSHIWNAIFCLKFYASWAVAAKSGEWDVRFVTYDEIVQRPEQCVRDIAEFFKLKITRPNVNLKAIQDNVNKGISGRGDMLHPYYRDLLERFAGTFKDIDFTPIGLK